MHLLFLGVVETTTKQVHDWCTRRRSGKQFIEYGEKVLSELASLGLPWLKIMKYSNTGRFGGWVSENYLGFSRFIPWFYSVIDEMTDAVPYVQPSKSVDQWNKIECKAWMRQKGVSGYDKYTLTQLRHYINDNLNKLTNVNIGTPGKWRSKTVMEKTESLSNHCLLFFRETNSSQFTQQSLEFIVLSHEQRNLYRKYKEAGRSVSPCVSMSVYRV